MSRRCVSTRPDVRLFPLFCALFFPVIPCSCAGGFSLAVARTCIVIPSHFPPVNRLYFFSALVDCTPGVRHENERLRAPAWPGIHSLDMRSPCPTGERE